MNVSSLGTASFLALALLLGAAGCASEPPVDERSSESMRQAVCSGGGGGGGESACTDATGFCPAECSVCFTSAAQRIRLQNMWNCTATGGGGGGGAGCSQRFINAAQDDCRIRCPYFDCGESSGIHECRVNGNGTNTYVCACATCSFPRVGDTF